MATCSAPPSIDEAGRHDSEAVPDQTSSFAPALPLEIILHVYQYMRASKIELQPLLRTLSLVCRTWYAAFIGQLFNTPHLRDRRFGSFARIVASNGHLSSRSIKPAQFVHSLDLGRLKVDNNSTTKLLGRIRYGLDTFVTPHNPLS